MRRTWLRSHPLVEDALLAAVLLAVVATVALPLSPRAPTASSENSVQAIWLLATACLMLVLRRRFTVATWAATLLISGIALVVSGQLAPVPALLVAMYTVAAYNKRWVALLCAVASAGLLLPGVLAQADPFNSWVALGLVAWIGMATAVGIAVRGQRALVKAAEARAAAAEASRREEALRAVAEERVRIARELHDVVAHHIAVVNVQAGVARHLLTSDPNAAAAALTEVRQAAQGALQETSVTLGLLRGPNERAERAPARSVADLTELVETVRRAGHEVRWRTEGPETPLPASVELACFRIVQEALTNAAKHGEGPILASLRYLPSTLVIEVSNSVRHGTATRPEGHGLMGMRERVAGLGGELSAGSHGHRFIVRAELPTTLTGDAP